MARPIVIAHHLIFTAYGWWLPNDPRGSNSKTIRNDVIAELGEVHHGRKRVQPASADIREFYREAGKRLRHELLTFSERDVSAIAAAFEEAIRSHRYTCWACAIMPDHVHLLIRKHKHLAEEMIANFQDQSRLRLRAEALRSTDHPVWGGLGWKVFLDHPDEVQRIVRYIQANPLKTGRPQQAWGFVKSYDGWPLHEGHSPKSPYVKALRASERYP
ncbi:MAG: transposase [Planctomycetes bacterium]|nr:transposase [Planctomycetota bacterium]